MQSTLSKPTEAPRRRRISWPNSSRMSEETFAYWLIVPVLAVLTAIMIYPTLYSIWISLFEVNVALETWDWAGLANYARALSSPDVSAAILRTVIYTVYVTTVSVAIAVAAALLLNEKFRGRLLVLGLVILPWSVSTYAAGVVFRFMYQPQQGFFNSVLQRLNLIQEPYIFINEQFVLLFIAIAHAWQYAPLGMSFVLLNLQIIPEDLYRIAKTDKLGPLGRFRHVMWPYVKTPILIYLVLVTAEAAKVFDIIYFLSGGGPGSASVHLVYLIYKETFVNLDLGYGAAISWILVVIVLALSTLYFLLLTRRRKQEAL